MDIDTLPIKPTLTSTCFVFSMFRILFRLTVLVCFSTGTLLWKEWINWLSWLSLGVLAQFRIHQSVMRYLSVGLASAPCRNSTDPGLNS
ncbi:hypothetical protein Hdeb2414_s0011g00361131 [Helianthus debilis subsp. tardiflorus]